MENDRLRGTGATPSCLSLINATTGQKIAEYTDAHISPEKLAPLAVGLARLFHDGDGQGALFCWEAAGPGLKFGQEVLALGYRHLWYKTDEFGTEQKQSDKPGWYPAPNNKLTLLMDYRGALQGRRVENRSDAALAECLAFKYDGRGFVEHANEFSTEDPTAARVNHADHVIADALAWKMVEVLGGIVRAERKEEIPWNTMAARREMFARKNREEEAWI